MNKKNIHGLRRICISAPGCHCCRLPSLPFPAVEVVVLVEVVMVIAHH